MSTALDATVKTTQKLAPAKLWKVIILNDNYTPIDFVVAVLVQLYGKSEDEAYAIANAVHVSGKGVAGIYTQEICLQKAADTCGIAKEHGHPLKAVAEEN